MVRFMHQLWKFMISAALCMVMASCGTEDKTTQPSPDNRQSVVGNALPPRPVPGAQSSRPAEMKLERLTEAEFLSKFRFRAKPMDYYLGTDFLDKIDPTLYHFQRVEVVGADGRATEIRMQWFGAWAIWKNGEDNWEMLTTMTNDAGVMMHLHTLKPNFESIGSFEIARRTVDGEAVTIRRGKFTNDETYEYTVATRNRGVLSDSVNGLMVILPSGNYKYLSETPAK